MKQIMRQLESLKDDGSLSHEEWQECIVKLSTIYGPWGDISTLREYSRPELISSLLELSLYLWYFTTIPVLIDIYGIQGYWVILVIVTFFNGFYIMSNHIILDSNRFD